MNSSPWRLGEHDARLELRGVVARVDLLRPARGMELVSVDGVATEGARLLAIEPPPAEYTRDQVDCYLRGSDLVVTYAATSAYPIRRQMYWRAGRPGGKHFALELVAASETPLLDTWSGMSATTVMPSAGLKVMNDRAGFAACDVSATAPQRFARPDHVGCFVVRLAIAGLSYIEVVHPQDFEASQAWASGALVCLRHELFSRPLEKGVILKARIACSIVRSDDEEEQARRLRDLVASSEPPLTV